MLTSLSYPSCDTDAIEEAKWRDKKLHPALDGAVLFFQVFLALLPGTQRVAFLHPFSLGADMRLSWKLRVTSIKRCKSQCRICHALVRLGPWAAKMKGALLVCNGHAALIRNKPSLSVTDLPFCSLVSCFHNKTLLVLIATGPSASGL